MLIDTGIELVDMECPLERIGQPLIDMAGFKLTKRRRPCAKSSGRGSRRRMWRTSTYPPTTQRWFGLEVRPIAIGLASDVLLVPLPGHT